MSPITADRNPDTSVPLVVRAAEAERVQDGPTSEIVLLADGEHTNGGVTINRALLELGSPGAPVHRHLDTTECLYVIDGALDVLVDDEVHTLRSGDLAVLTPGTAHAFAPAAGHRADMLAIFAPGQERFAYYRLLERLHRGTATLDELMATAALYDNHYAESEAWQRRAS
ncbi:cupin domain-containing protein [Nocardioides antri]|uniref:Cupin domain-containing protein n=1 Tax=Nocardioides antri TaxID=2607659 RepID=A0A5B1LY18_9ACTN|nr:cupin domain-containing protein [Nocardioides antri]KAA1424300.1 cupin domain-containing protein [Nocardioides antri]